MGLNPGVPTTTIKKGMILRSHSNRDKNFLTGMDEMEFTEAESNMNDLISEYQQYQVREYQLYF